MDSIGGNLDAFTAKECVCFNVKVLDEHLPIAMDILSDLVLEPHLSRIRYQQRARRHSGRDQDGRGQSRPARSRNLHPEFLEGPSAGGPILGTKETVRGFHQAMLFDYYGASLVPGNMVISAAGNLKHDNFVELVTSTFEHLRRGTGAFHEVPPKPQARIMLRNKKSLEQVQICLGVPSYSISHEKRYASFVLNTLLGGGMSSRLFQNIRERQGLVYSIFSELNPYRDTGCLAVYAGTSRDSASKVVHSIVNEFRELKENPVSAEELQRAKNQLKGSLMLSMESSTARMSNLARQEMYYNRFFGMNEIIERVEAVTAEDVLEFANEFFRSDEIAVTVLGNLNGLKITRDLLAC